MPAILGVVCDAKTRHSGARHEPSASLPLRSAVKLLHDLVFHGEAVTFGREGSAADFLGVLLHRIADRVARFGVALDEGRREAAEETDHVMEHEYLPVAVGAR